MNNILIVDDDGDLLELIQRYLSQHGLHVDVATSGTQMDKKMATHQFDALILDVMLPDEDGISLCRRVRARSPIPIIMLTAVTDTPDRVVGLEIGADDYVTKPFDPRELLARIRAVLRRALSSGASTACSQYHFQRWRLDLVRRELRHLDNTLVPISGGEFALLVAFLEHPGQLLTRDQLLDHTKGNGHDVFDRSIDVLISRIRRKIESNPRRPEMIRTVRHAGYIFTPSVSRS